MSDLIVEKVKSYLADWWSKNIWRCYWRCRWWNN